MSFWIVAGVVFLVVLGATTWANRPRDRGVRESDRGYEPGAGGFASRDIGPGPPGG